MPLRFLSLKEPNYVPNYNTLDTNLINTVDTQIQQQGQLARQYQADTIDMTAQNMSENFQGLNDTDRNYVRNRIYQSKENIDKGFAERGARNMIPHINREVSNLSKDLAIPKSISAKISAAQEKIAESEEMPNSIRQTLLNDLSTTSVEYDPETGAPIGTKGGLNQNDLNIASNWEDWTSDIQSFVNNIEDDGYETGYFNEQGQLNMAQFGINEEDYAVFRKKIVGKSSNKIESAVASFLYSHPKYREQLQLLGKNTIRNVKASNEDAVLKNEDGTFTVKVEDYVRDSNGNRIKEGEDEYGNPIYKTQEVGKTFSSYAQYAAADIASAYGKQGGQRVTLTDKIVPSSLSGRGSNGSGTNDGRFVFTDSIAIPEISGREYLSSLSTEIDSIQRNVDVINSRASNKFSQIEGFKNTLVDDQGEIMMQFEGEEGALTINEAFERNKINEGQKNDLLGFQRLSMDLKEEADTLRQTRDGAVDAAFTDMLEFYQKSWRDGQGLELHDLIEVSPEGYLTAKEPPERELTRESLEGLNLQIGEETLIGNRGASYRVKRINSDRIEVEPAQDIVLKYQGKFNEYLQKHTDRLSKSGQRLQTKGVKLSPEKDKDLIKMFEEDPTIVSSAGTGEFYNADGTALSVDDAPYFARFKPTDALFDYNTDNDGDIVLQGYFVDHNGHPLDDEQYQNVVYRGDLAQNAGSSVFGEEEYRQLLSYNSFIRKTNPLYGSVKNIKLSEVDLKGMNLYNLGRVDIEQKTASVNRTASTLLHTTIYDKQGKEIARNSFLNPEQLYEFIMVHNE